MGKVQAGSTATIKRGAICTYNETSGYFQMANAVADYVYSLAIANEEQKSGDLARYIQFMALRAGDVFEFELAAAAAVAYGDGYTLTASQAQKLTADADGSVVARVVGHSNVPEVGTTLRTVSYAEFSFLPCFSYIYKNVRMPGVKKVLAKTAAYTLLPEDIGAIVTNKGASASVTLTAPSGTVPIGWHVSIAVMADQAFLFDPKPDTAGVYIKGAAQAAGKYISMTDIGDFVELVWDGTDWLAIAGISGADADITVQT
jgi:hypothetical protein